MCSRRFHLSSKLVIPVCTSVDKSPRSRISDDVRECVEKFSAYLCNVHRNKFHPQASRNGNNSQLRHSQLSIIQLRMCSLLLVTRGKHCFPRMKILANETDLRRGSVTCQLLQSQIRPNHDPHDPRLVLKRDITVNPSPCHKCIARHGGPAFLLAAGRKRHRERERECRREG